MPRLPSPDDFSPSIPTPTRGINRVEAAPVSGGLVKLGNQFAQMAIQEADKLAETQADDAITKLRGKSLELTVDPEKGFRSIQGGGVVQSKVTDDYPARLQNEIETLSAPLSRVARERFQAQASGEMNSFKRSVYLHVAEQTGKYQDDTFAAAMNQGSKEASEAPEKLAETIARSSVILDKELARKGITDPDQVAVMKQKYLGGAISSAIGGLIDRGDSASALALFEERKKELSQQQQEHFGPIIRKQNDWSVGSGIAKQAMAVPAGERQDVITKLTKGNKGQWEAAQSQLVQEEQAERAKNDDKWGGLLLGFSKSTTRATMVKILADPTFVSMPKAEQAKHSEYMRHQVNADEARRRGEADRVEREQAIKWDKNPAALDTFYQLTQMPDLGAMTSGQVYMYARAIGPQLTKKLDIIRAQMAHEATAFKFDKATLDDAIPKELLLPQNKETRNAFLGITQRSLADWKEKNPGRTPNDVEQLDILRSASKEYVTDKPWYSFGVGKQKAYELADMPSDFVSGANKAARAKGRKTDLSYAQLLELWSKQPGARK